MYESQLYEIQGKRFHEKKYRKRVAVVRPSCASSAEEMSSSSLAINLCTKSRSLRNAENSLPKMPGKKETIDSLRKTFNLRIAMAKPKKSSHPLDQLNGVEVGQINYIVHQAR